VGSAGPNLAILSTGYPSMPQAAIGGGAIAVPQTAFGGYSPAIPPASAQGRFAAAAGSNPLDQYFRQYVQQMRGQAW